MELWLKNIDYLASVKELVDFLELFCGKSSIFSCEIKLDANGNSRGFGFVNLESEAAAHTLLRQASDRNLLFRGRQLIVDFNNRRNSIPKRKVVPETRYASGGKMYLGNLRDDATFESLWCSNASVKVGVVNRVNSSELRFTMKAADAIEYRIDFPFESIFSVESCMLLHGKADQGLLLQLEYQPRIFERYADTSLEVEVPDLISQMARLHVTRHTYSKGDEFGPRWVRTADFTTGKAFGQSVAVCFAFPDHSQRDILNLLKVFHDFGMDVNMSDMFKKRMSVGRGRFFATKQEVVPIIYCTRIPLEVVFKLNYLVQDGFISPLGLDGDFLDLLADTCLNKSTDRCLHALKEFGNSENTCLDPANKMREHLNNVRISGMIIPDSGQVYIKKVMITPVKAYFLGPELEVSNRITRNFRHKLDNFLRVSFTEEDYDTLPSAALNVPRKGGVEAGVGLQHSSVYSRILSVLQNGIQFGGMDYQFLAFSPSQLKDSSIWMFASDHEVTASSIRQWMGDFLDIRNVAKCAARMGQSFSSSTHTANVPLHEVNKIPDIDRVSLRNGVKYCFSDGIGTISKDFALAVAKKCRLRTVPSAFQIRYGGYKGVVAVDPSSPFKLSLRPSMYKFPSTQIGLDVITWTKRMPLYLNRQIILLLSTLGVPNLAFQVLQNQVVRQLDRMLEDGAVALELLQNIYGGESHQLMVEMLCAGYEPYIEPYLRNLLEAFRASQLFMLRTKSRILVPKGRRLLGCLDEYATLAYGQCFVQVSATPEEVAASGDHKIKIRYVGVSRREPAFLVTGWVVVAKNPCLHPGDILVLEAVDVPELHHMVDCIVFPQLGDRPHPNESSGSDLDGDDYFVSWDRSLIPPWSDAPMNYEPIATTQLDHPVTLKEIQEFFVDHMANNSLGLISSAHLVHADLEPEQARSDKCLALAQLASIAVDFGKTGVPAALPMNLRPLSYPDFMEKEDKTTYPSERVIGKLFRTVLDHTFSKMVLPDPSRAYDQELVVDGYQQFLTEASNCKMVYDKKLRSLMSQYEVSEAEIMSGSFVNISKFYRKRRQGEIKEKIILASRALIKEAKGWFEDEEGFDEAAKAYAWYHVTYAPEMRQSDGQKELLSFPWVVSDELLRVKRSRGSR